MVKIKEALILTGITLIAGLLLGGAYELTKGTIAQQQIAANTAAYKAVSPGTSEFKSDDSLKDKVKGAQQLLEKSGMALGNVTVDEALYAVDESGGVKGVIVKTTSKDGYGGDIRIVVGIEENGAESKVTGIDFLEINETAGLGMKAVEPAFKDQFADKNVTSFELPGKEAAGGNQIEAVSGATFTSEAVTNAVNAAVYFARESVFRQ